MTTLARVGAAAAVARAAASAPWPGGATRWDRTNHRGGTVSLRSGPALALAAALTARAPQPAAATAGVLAAVLGAYDDVAGARDHERGDKGFRGHVGALRDGRVSAGNVKLVGIGAAGLAATALLPGRQTLPDLLLGAGVVAGSANLLNLLDLRPGRALKVGLAGAALLGEPGPAAAAAALLPADLGEREMLGDTGANALGAVLGLALTARAGRSGRAVALVILAALTGASEVVSFSAVIDRAPPLRAIDRLGRRL